MSRQRGQKPSSGLIAGALTVVLALAVSLAGLEAIVRVLDGVGFGARNYVADRLSLLASAYPSVYHPQLGYVPEPDYDGTANAWNTRVTIDSASLRQNAPDRPVPTPVAVLAAGDSYTSGGAVSDGETWPAKLPGLPGTGRASGWDRMGSDVE